MDEIVKVLIVEDSEDDVILMTHYIKQKCVNVDYIWVDSRSKLLAQLELDTKWDLVICDKTLPQLTGTDAILLIKDKLPNIPIICVSGSSIGEEYKKCIEVGALAFVDKTNLEELADTVYELLTKK